MKQNIKTKLKPKFAGGGNNIPINKQDNTKVVIPTKIQSKVLTQEQLDNYFDKQNKTLFPETNFVNNLDKYLIGYANDKDILEDRKYHVNKYLDTKKPKYFAGGDTLTTGLGAAAGIAGMIPGGQIIGAGLGLASMVSNMINTGDKEKEAVDAQNKITAENEAIQMKQRTDVEAENQRNFGSNTQMSSFYQKGGKDKSNLFRTNKTQYVDSVLNANTDKEWVKRLTQENTPSIPMPTSIQGYKPGMRSTHLMSDDNNGFVYPSVNNVNNKLQYMAGDEAYDYAKENNTGIQLPKEQGTWFARNGYKQGTNVLKHKFAGGGNALQQVAEDGVIVNGKSHEQGGVDYGNIEVEKGETIKKEQDGDFIFSTEFKPDGKTDAGAISKQLFQKKQILQQQSGLVATDIDRQQNALKISPSRIDSNTKGREVSRGQFKQKNLETQIQQTDATIEQLKQMQIQWGQQKGIYDKDGNNLVADQPLNQQEQPQDNQQQEQPQARVGGNFKPKFEGEGHYEDGIWVPDNVTNVTYNLPTVTTSAKDLTLKHKLQGIDIPEWKNSNTIVNTQNDGGLLNKSNINSTPKQVYNPLDALKPSYNKMQVNDKINMFDDNTNFDYSDNNNATTTKDTTPKPNPLSDKNINTGLDIASTLVNFASNSQTAKNMAKLKTPGYVPIESVKTSKINMGADRNAVIQQNKSYDTWAQNNMANPQQIAIMKQAQQNQGQQQLDKINQYEQNANTQIEEQNANRNMQTQQINNAGMQDYNQRVLGKSVSDIQNQANVTKGLLYDVRTSLANREHSMQQDRAYELMKLQVQNTPGVGRDVVNAMDNSNLTKEQFLEAFEKGEIDINGKPIFTKRNIDILSPKMKK